MTPVKRYISVRNPGAVHKFTFIDLFAGIGGTRLAFQELGGECIFSSEINKHARLIYLQNFGDIPQEDITELDPNSKEIGNPDILLAGFPCQAFSIAGNREGFEDPRGALFYRVEDILRAKMPKAFFLENVKGLLSNDGGKTIAEILSILREDLGYYVPDPQAINAKDFGIPQNRERVFIVGFRKDLGIDDFEYPAPTVSDSDKPLCVRPLLEAGPVSIKYYLSQGYYDGLVRHRIEQKKKGRGFGYRLLDPDTQIANTITAGSMGRERNLIVGEKPPDLTPETHIRTPVNSQFVRRLTPRECARLMGFKNEFNLDGVADSNLYKLIGNSVAVDAVYHTGRAMIDKLESAGVFPVKQTSELNSTRNASDDRGQPYP